MTGPAGPEGRRDRDRPPAEETAPDPAARAAHGHAHHHGSLRLTSGSSPVGRALAGVALACLALTVVGLVLLRPTGEAPDAPGVTPGTIFVDGTVEQRFTVPCPDEIDPAIACADVSVRITSGPTAGDRTELQLALWLPTSPDLFPGDDIRLSYFAQATEGFEYAFVDYQRDQPLLALGALFVLAVVVLSRFQGVRALIGMVLSLLVIVFYLLPGLLRGGPPLPLAVVSAMAIAFLVLYLAHGVHSGTHVAFVASVLALTVTGVLGVVFVGLASITGFADENVQTLTVAAGDLDFRGLLLAGLVIGALGVLDDVTVTQVSAMTELRRAAPTASAFRLYRAGLRIGRDHVASTVNTLVLAYAGAALPLLLLFTQGGRSTVDVLTSEAVAVEVIRALVGSLGIVSAIPISTGLAALVIHHDRDGTEDLLAGTDPHDDHPDATADLLTDDEPRSRWWRPADPFADVATEPTPDLSPDTGPDDPHGFDDDLWTTPDDETR